MFSLLIHKVTDGSGNVNHIITVEDSSSNSSVPVSGSKDQKYTQSSSLLNSSDNKPSYSAVAEGKAKKDSLVNSSRPSTPTTDDAASDHDDANSTTPIISDTGKDSKKQSETQNGSNKKKKATTTGKSESSFWLFRLIAYFFNSIGSFFRRIFSSEPSQG